MVEKKNEYKDIPQTSDRPRVTQVQRFYLLTVASVNKFPVPVIFYRHANTTSIFGGAKNNLCAMFTQNMRGASDVE